MAFESPFARAFQSRFSRRFTCPDLQDDEAGGGLPTPPPPPPDVLLDIDFFSELPAGSNFTHDGAAVSFENAAGLIEFQTAENTPVFEHRNGVPLGLVMERVEANNQSNSETFTGAGWEAPTGLVLGTDPAHVNPDGTVGGVQFTETGTATVHEFSTTPFNSGNETAWSISVHFPADASRRLIIDGEDAIGASALFDLTPSTGFVVTTSGVADDLDAEIRPIGNFYRITLTGTGNNTTNGISFKFARPTHNTTADDIYDADPAIGLFPWGAQRESREYPTSYIRNTTNANVTRRDTRLNIPFDLPADDFSFVFEWAVPFDFNDDKVTTQRMISFNRNGSTEDDSVELYLARFNQGLIAEKTVAGATSRTIGFANEPQYPSGFIWRVALAVSNGEQARGSFLGGAINTSAAVEWGLPFTEAPNTLTLGRRTNSVNGVTSDLYARRLKVYNRALTDAELMAESAL